MSARDERLRTLQRAADKLRAQLLLLARETELEGLPGEAMRLNEHSTTLWRVQADLDLLRQDGRDREKFGERRRQGQSSSQMVHA